MTASQALVLQWILGAIVVCLYARERFDGPEPVRPTTTFTRYWTARLGYQTAMLSLYLVLAGLATDAKFDALRRVIGMDALVEDVQALPGPLIAALALTSLLPHIPYLSRIDDVVRHWFRRLGNIPFEVRELAARLAATHPQPALACDGLRAALAATGVDASWLDAPRESARNRWARAAVLQAVIREWRALPAYARYLAEQDARVTRLGERVGMFAALGAAEFDRIDRNRRRPGANPWQRQLSRELDDLHERLCEFVAGGLLQVERSPGQRYAMLARMGFGTLERPRRALSVHEVCLIGGAVYLAFAFGTLALSQIVSGPAAPPRIRLLVMVPLIHMVAIAAAVYPKAVWSFADVRRVGHRPFAAYIASGAIAAGAAFVISLLFRFTLEQNGGLFHALAVPGSFIEATLETARRWPWLLTAFFGSVAVAWAADDNWDGASTDASRLRWIEMGALAGTYGAVQWLVVELLMMVSDRAPWFAARQLQLVATGMVVGACIGWFVPHLYRTRSADAFGSERLMPQGAAA